jgi:hypothetical protein
MHIFFSGARGDTGPEMFKQPQKPPVKFYCMMTFFDFIISDKRRAMNRLKEHIKNRENLLLRKSK